MLAFAVIMGLSGVFVVSILVHDSMHNAIAKNRSVNKIVSYLGDLLGINTYIWYIRHCIQHHAFTNVMGGDLIMDNAPLIRLSPHHAYRKFHKLQVYYTPFFYAFYTFYWIFLLDFNLFLKKEICNLEDIKHPPIEWFKLFFFKIVYITYILIIPIILLDVSWYWIIAGFFIMHFFAGLYLSIIGVVSHYVMDITFAEPDIQGNLETSWGENQMASTIDFAPQSRLLNIITGGLTTHIAHHLFPTICHCHYMRITPIIKSYCEEHGCNYRSKTLIGAIKSHFKHLKNLSTPVPAISYP
jgi:linoleoyl-CoA desaturase